MRIAVDRDELARIARAHGVLRLRAFGSVVSERFREGSSDVDVLVDFQPGLEDPFAAYFDLKDDLERLFGRPVDLVMPDAVRNPHVRSSIFGSAEELYAA